MKLDENLVKHGKSSKVEEDHLIKGNDKTMKYWKVKMHWSHSRGIDIFLLGIDCFLDESGHGTKRTKRPLVRHALNVGQRKLRKAIRETVVGNQYYTALVQYKKQHGNCEVPRLYKKDPSLGSWVHNQRSLRKAIQCMKRRSKPEYERQFEKLEKLRFNWELVKRDRSWDEYCVYRNRAVQERAWELLCS
jgi:hypothetical protein